MHFRSAQTTIRRIDPNKSAWQPESMARLEIKLPCPECGNSLLSQYGLVPFHPTDSCTLLPRPLRLKTRDNRGRSGHALIGCAPAVTRLPKPERTNVAV